MVKYRLTWQGTGALDLSQVADEIGMPVLFTRPGDSVIVTAGTFQHPLVQNYIGNGLGAERLGAVVDARPVSPAVTAPPPPPPLPPPPEPLLVAPPAPPTEVAVPTPEPKAATPESEVSTPELEAPAPESEAAVPSAEVSEEPTRGRGGRVPRGRAR